MRVWVHAQNNKESFSATFTACENISLTHTAESLQCSAELLDYCLDVFLLLKIRVFWDVTLTELWKFGYVSKVWWRHRQHKTVLPDPGEEGTTLFRNVRNHLSNTPGRLNLKKKPAVAISYINILKFFQQFRASGQIWGIILIGAV